VHVGLFFGSFNPVHVGHMVLANYMLYETDLDQVWFVVSPQNPLKTGTQLLDQVHRLMLVDTAIGDHQALRSSNIEFSLPKPSYTVHTLAHLVEKYPMHQFSLIMGSDNLQSFSRWKNHEAILSKHKIFVYPRPGYDGGEFKKHSAVQMTEAPLMEISSTFIRKAIKEKKDVRFFLPLPVWEEIMTMHFYEK
jgi:nicotinate-nucleotide adenylyltransferase